MVSIRSPIRSMSRDREKMIDLADMSLNTKKLTLNLPTTSKTKSKPTKLRRAGQTKAAS